MTTLLFVAHSFPPQNDSGGIRTWRTVRKLAEEYEIVVLTHDSPGTSELVGQLPTNVTVRRTWDQSTYTSSEYRPFWLPGALNAARDIVQRRDVDLVWSYFTPIATHIVALAVTRWTDIPWIAHFSDPWVDSPYKAGDWKTSRRIERTVVESADRITVPTERLAEMFRAQYDLRHEKCHVVPNFVDPEEIERIKPVARKDDKIRFTHLGNLYGLRTPEPVFQALSTLADQYRNGTEVELIGNYVFGDDLVEEHGVNDAVRRIDRLPKDDAMARAKASDVLLLIDAPVEPSPFLPMKLVEYLFMDRPILAVTPLAGTSADVIGETNTGVVVSPEEPDEIAGAIRSFHDSGRVLDVDHDARSQFTASSAVGRLSTIIDELLSNRTA